MFFCKLKNNSTTYRTTLYKCPCPSSGVQHCIYFTQTKLFTCKINVRQPLMMTSSKLFSNLHYFLPARHHYCMFKLFTNNNLINFEHPLCNLKYIAFLIISPTTSCKSTSLCFTFGLINSFHSLSFCYYFIFFIGTSLFTIFSKVPAFH